MPVDLAHGAGFDRYERGSEVGCDGEGGRVDYFDRTPRDDVGGLLREVVGVGCVRGEMTCWARGVLLGDVGRCGRAVEDVELVLR